MRVVNRNTPRIVTPSEMKDGEIGVIIKWNDDEECIGNIVQMFGDRLISIGQPREKSWAGGSLSISNPSYQIEILPKGTTLEI